MIGSFANFLFKQFSYFIKNIIFRKANNLGKLSQFGANNKSLISNQLTIPYKIQNKDSLNQIINTYSGKSNIGNQLSKLLNLKQFLLNSIIEKLKQTFNLQNLLSVFIWAVGILYRIFIFVQMCILGYGETLRLKKYINFMINNSKKLKINQY